MNGEEIRDIRLSLGDTRAQFAKRLGVHPRTLRGWENGEFTPRVGVILAKLRRLKAKVA